MKYKTILSFAVLVVLMALAAACGQRATTEGHIIYAKVVGPGFVFSKLEWWSIEPDGSNPRKFDIPATIHRVGSNPAGSLVLFPGGGEDSYVAEPDGRNARPLHLPERVELQLSKYHFSTTRFSPDGRKGKALASSAASEGLYLIDLATAQVKELSSSKFIAFYEFSPDGKWVAFYSEDGILLIGPDREDHRLVEGGWLVGFSPDSNGLLYTRREADSLALYIETLYGSERREIMRADYFFQVLAVLPDQPVVLIRVPIEENGREEVAIEAVDLDSSSRRWVLQGLPPNSIGKLSPNGNRFVLQYVQEEQVTCLSIDVATGVSEELLRASHDRPFLIEFSPDGGSVLLTAHTSAYAYVADLEAGRYTQLVRPDETLDRESPDQPRVVSWEWAPDGRKLVLIVANLKEEEWTAFLVDSDGGNLRQLVTASHVAGHFSPDGQRIALGLRERVKDQDPKRTIHLVDVDTFESTLFLEEAILFLWVR